MRKKNDIAPTVGGIIVFIFALSFFVMALLYGSPAVIIVSSVCLLFFISSMFIARQNLKKLVFEKIEIGGFSARDNGKIQLFFRSSKQVNKANFALELLAPGQEQLQGSKKQTFSLSQVQKQALFSIDVIKKERGVYKIARMRIKSKYPFAWFTSLKTFKKPVDFYVYPEPKSLLQKEFASSEWNINKGQQFAGESKFLARRKILQQKKIDAETTKVRTIDWEQLSELNFEDKLSQLTYWILARPKLEKIKLNLPNRQFEIADSQTQALVLQELATLQENDL